MILKACCPAVQRGSVQDRGQRTRINGSFRASVEQLYLTACMRMLSFAESGGRRSASKTKVSLTKTGGRHGEVGQAHRRRARVRARVLWSACCAVHDRRQRREGDV